MSSRCYLPLRQDVIAKHIFENLMKKIDPHRKITYSDELFEEKEFWWNVKVKTTTNIKKNRPDLIIWNLNSKECQVVEFSCLGDINVTRKLQEKEKTHGPCYVIYKFYIWNILTSIFLLSMEHLEVYHVT